MSISDITKTVQRENIAEVALQFTDISGALHSLWVPSGLLPKIQKDGIHMDGSSVDMVDISQSDLKLMPDLATFTVIPGGLYRTKVARMVCDVYEPDSNRQFRMDPRFVLRKVMRDSTRILGPSVEYDACSEMEFFLFRRDEGGNLVGYDEGGYLASPPQDRGIDVRLEITGSLRSVGIVVEKHHHEVPPGKYELNLRYAEAVRMADTIYLVKSVVKMTAAQKGLVASFMPKPFHEGYGAGLHTHVSLIDRRRGRNLFYDPKGKHGISRMAMSFMAGILTHARALAALTNPSVNSYKRLVPGWEAPVYISWARYNRSVLVRVPPGKKMTSRLEYRPTDGTCNFYLAFAAILAAGVDGVRRGLEAPEPVEENIYEMNEKQRKEEGIGVLPGNLGEALAEFAKDRYLRESLGEEFSEKFLRLKTREWREFNLVVHEWERKKYLDA
jgi:glutamine synthetase